MNQCSRIERLPRYVFNLVSEFKKEAFQKGIKYLEFGMGNPDHPTPQHIVDALTRAAQIPANHRYSDSRGIFPLRSALCDWYRRRYEVDLNPESETVVTIGSKEGLALAAMALVDDGDHVLVPSPSYPIHYYGFVIAGASIGEIALDPLDDLGARIESSIANAKHKPKILVLNFPSNPSAQCVELPFFEHMVDLAKHYDFKIIHDFAYADITFDDFKAPSILQVPGAKDVAIESYSLSKSFNMPGWRLGFMSGNREMIAALTKIKSYTSYGLFAPIEYAAIAALEGPQQCLEDIRSCYQQRRDWLCDGLNSIGWQVTKPRATMFLWTQIPEAYREMGSLQFSKYMIDNAGVALSPGIGFGKTADDYVRFALIQSEVAIKQAVTNIEKMFNKDKILVQPSNAVV